VHRTYEYNPRFCPSEVVEKIDKHTAAIAVYFTMGYEEYQKRLKERDPKTTMIEGELLWDFWSTQIKIPLGNVDKGIYAIAYLGNGSILKDNHSIQVSHLFHYNSNTYDMRTWVMLEGWDHAIEADLVAISENVLFSDDYAVIKLREDTGLPGLKIAVIPPEKGDKVIYSGSTGGLFNLTRFGILTDLQYFFRKEYDGTLRLSRYEDFKYKCVFPGGHGDSGGSIKNIRGEIVGIMYCGVAVEYESYVFSNPLSMIWSFLTKHNLTELAR